MSACEEEPCKSLIDDYWGKAIATMQFKQSLQLWCGLRNMVRNLVIAMFLLWFAVFSHAIACLAGIMPSSFCNALVVASFILLGLLAVVSIVYGLLSERVRRLSIVCRELYIASLEAYKALIQGCPKECWPDLQKIDCDCG